MKQRLYLLKVDKNELDENSWNFNVKGLTNCYDLKFRFDMISCSCPDFEGRGRICKHLYFIIGRIAQCSHLLDILENDIENGSRKCLTPEELDVISKALIHRLKDHLTPTEEGNQVDTSTLDYECTICFDSLGEGKVISCQRGKGCKYYFHEDCIENWLRVQSRCPMCRRDWNPNSGEYNPLQKLKESEISL